jgi:hypothetical protein
MQKIKTVIPIAFMGLHPEMGGISRECDLKHSEK